MTCASDSSTSAESLASATTLNPDTGSDDTVANILVGATAKMGENMVLRRTTKVIAENGVVVTCVLLPRVCLVSHISTAPHCRYTHNSIHEHQGKIGVALALGGPSVNVAEHAEKLTSIGKVIAMHIAAANPAFLDSTSVPADVLESEREIIQAQIGESGKPAEVVEKIVSGRMRKFLSEICLVDQTCMLDSEGRTVAKFLGDSLKKQGLPADVQLQQFAVFVRGGAE
jgi:elongation factor Ts